MEKAILIEFGNRLRVVREKLGLKQREFALRIEKTPAFLSEIETGKSNPGFGVLRKIAETFNINLNYLMFGEGEVFKGRHGEGGAEREAYGIDDEKFNEMVNYFKRAPVVKYAVYEYFTQYIHKNREVIEADADVYADPSARKG